MFRKVLSLVLYLHWKQPRQRATKTDKMARLPNGISVSVQYEHLHNSTQAIFLSLSAGVNAPLLTGGIYVIIKVQHQLRYLWRNHDTNGLITLAVSWTGTGTETWRNGFMVLM